MLTASLYRTILIRFRLRFPSLHPAHSSGSLEGSVLLQFSPSLSDFDCVSPVRTRLTREAHSRGSLERLTREAHLRGLGAVTVISATAILSFAIRLRLRFSSLHPAHSRGSFEGLTREAHSRGSLERIIREARSTGSLDWLTR